MKYIFARKLSVGFLRIREDEDNENALVAYIESILYEEGSLSDIAKKYAEINDSGVDNLVSEIKYEASKISDKVFIYNIRSQKILDKFFEEYKEWRTQIFPSKMARIICEYVEGLYPSNLVLHVVDIEGNDSIFKNIFLKTLMILINLHN